MQGRASPFVRCCSVACKAISDILKSLLAWQTDEAHLNRIIKALRNWLTSPDLTLRERATRSLIQLLQIYKRQIPSENPTIRNKGHWIGLLVPFCVHTEPAFQYWDLLAAKHEIPSSSNSLGWINQPRSDDDICSPVRETGGEVWSRQSGSSWRSGDHRWSGVVILCGEIQVSVFQPGNHCRRGIKSGLRSRHGSQ
ncbi:uncharacterized protein LOC116507598 isoform X3 [Thamnophis elegans]|uniref:uncharacterized protein LOC116507598 isoform X3 n=1 Tax=Thamnophis elegans TaxID=35005 RepID=UPI001377E59A|nr:uncharacterized protein LOC116507598 isoform X3 [Thamnophis elegans]